MINLFDRSQRYLRRAIILFVTLLFTLGVLTVIGWRIPWFVLAWWQAPSPLQIGMLRWDQQGLPVKVKIIAENGAEAIKLSDVAFDGNHLWVTGVYTDTNGENGAVFQVDPRTYKTLDTVILDKDDQKVDPLGIVFDGQHIWVANRGSSSLSCFDPTKEKSVATTWELKNNEKKAESPYYLAFDGEDIWVTDRDANTVWRLPAGSCDRPETDYSDTQITKINGMDFSQPFGIIFDGTYIWVTNQGSNTVIRLDPDSCDADECTRAQKINVSDKDQSEPSNLAYDGTFVWITLRGTGEVARIHAQTGRVFGKRVIGQPIRISDLTTMGNPLNKTKLCSHVTEKLDGIAFDGKYIWIASDTGWVCQLQANDITPVSEFCVYGKNCPADNEEAVSRVAFDGTFVWIIITNDEGSSFTRR